MIKYINTDPVSTRKLYVLQLKDFILDMDLSDYKYFVVLLVENSSLPDRKKLFSFYEKLIDSGMVYLCVWGKHCELIHDIADEVITAPEYEDKYKKFYGWGDEFLPTTWHADEPLPEPLWYAIYAAHPADSYFDKTKNVIAIVIDDEKTSSEIEEYMSDLEKLNTLVL